MKLLFALLVMQILVSAAPTMQTGVSASPQVLNLWSGSIPGPAAKVDGAERDLTKPEDKLIAGKRIIKLGHVSTPQMHVFLSTKEKANGGAVLICPGGGFNILAWDLEGTEVAEWLNSLGFAAIVVKYRVPVDPALKGQFEANGLPMKSIGPAMDAQRAMSLTRAHAAEWGIDPQRIGIMGFSAGGETAGLTAVLRDQRLYAKVDASDEHSCAPNFALPIYPGGFFDKDTGALNAWLKVTKDTPPMFFAMAADDHVNAENCTVLFTALKRAKVPAELHVFTRGGHGYGLRLTFAPVTHWSNHAADWLRDMGFASSSAALAAAGTPAMGNPADHLPPHIRQLTNFGERAEFSHDGRTVFFLSKQFGDVMACDLASGRIRCVTQHFKHHGFNRVFVLWNDDLLLTGPDMAFDTTDKDARKNARQHAKGFVLDKSFTKPPTPLGLTMLEGPAVSRTRPLIAWTHNTDGDLRQSRISMGELVYENGVPKMKNVRQLVTAKDFPEGQRPKMLETQNFVPPGDKQLTLTAYQLEGTANSEGYLLDLDTHALTNFTRSPEHYEEVEGVFPDGKSTTVERNGHLGKPWPLIDLWRAWFDGSKEPQRLTRFLDFPGYKAANPVISDDGTTMAFQLGISGDEAGVGYGIFLMDLTK